MAPFYLDWQLSVPNKFKTKIEISGIIFRIITNVNRYSHYNLLNMHESF